MSYLKQKKTFSSVVCNEGLSMILIGVLSLRLFPFPFFNSLLVVRNWIWNLFHVLDMERMALYQFFRYSTC